jgi:DNA-binding winged helix-turn-helix (wHTH) protein
MSNQQQHLYEFGPFLLDTSERKLFRDGEAVALTSKAFDTLLVLVERKGKVVEKEALMSAVWPDSFVEESNLTNNVYVLRQVLGLGEGGKGYIETEPRRGYRFTAQVRELPQASHEEVVLERHAVTRIVTEEEEPSGHGEKIEQSPARSLPAKGQRDRFLSWKIWGALLFLCLLLIGGVASVLYYRSHSSANLRNQTAHPAVKSIAVMPFINEGGNQETEYLSDGLTVAGFEDHGTLLNLQVQGQRD